MLLHKDTRLIKQIDEENLNSKKVFIQYPIPKTCNLRCEYCFHKEYFDKRPDTIKYANTRGFDFYQFKNWMESNIYPNFEQIVIHPSGGEPFFMENIWLIEDLMAWTRPEVKIDILTNGIARDNLVDIVASWKDRFHRIGFTFHRKTLCNRQNSIDTFKCNVLRVRDLGVQVYVKEILFKEYLIDILKHRNYWRDQGIPFKIQDYQALDASHQDYNERDLLLIDDEYKHQGNYCSCWQGWRSISIRGYDIAAGNVVACWLDPKIIGNIPDNTLNLNFHVDINESLGRRNVTGGDFHYSKKGTYERDRKCEH